MLGIHFQKIGAAVTAGVMGQCRDRPEVVTNFSDRRLYALTDGDIGRHNQHFAAARADLVSHRLTGFHMPR